ncbi:MAG: FtsX-like permease family protein [Candidatus Thorarchaeota archaeon]|jgi:putative ABC transport system permease protein
MSRFLLMKKAYRDLKQQRLGLLGALALVLSGALTYVIFDASLVVTKESFDATFEEMAIADLTIITLGSSPSLLDAVRALSSVEAADVRYDAHGLVELAAGARYSGDFFGISPSRMPDVYKIKLREGVYLDENNNRSVLVESGFAEVHEISPGDNLSIVIFNQTVDMNVVGIVWSIEYLLPATNMRQLIPQRGSSAALFMDLDLLSNLAGQDGLVNEFSVVFSESADRTVATAEVLSILSGEQIIFTLNGDELVEGMEWVPEIDMGLQMTPVMAGIVLGTSVVVIYVVIRRVVDTQRQSIGVLMAQGYSARTLEAGYVSVFVGITIIGSIIMTIIATPITVWLTEVSFEGWGVTVVSGPLPLDILIWGFLSAPVTALIASGPPLHRISSLQPIEAIRGTGLDHASLKKPYLESAAERLGARGYLTRFMFRSISRHKMRALMLCVGIAIGSFTYMNSVLYIDSIFRSIDVHMDEHSQWDIVVDSRQPLTSTEFETVINNVDGILSYEPFLKISIFSQLMESEQPLEMLFLNSTSGIQTLDVIEGRDFMSNNEVVLESRIAESRGLQIGSSMTIRIGSETHDVEVVGIAESLFRSVFLDYGLAPTRQNESLLTGAFLRLSETADFADVAERIEGSDLIESAQTHSEAVQGVKAMFAFYDVMLYFILAMCLAVTILVVWTIVSISTMERIPQFAQLEAIGFDRPRIRKMMIGEVLLLSLVASTISIIPSVWLGYVLLPLMYQTLSIMEFFVDPLILVVSWALPVLVAVVSLLPAFRTLNRIDLPAVLSESNPQ